MAGDVPPAVDEEDDVGVCKGVGLGRVAPEGVEIKGDALWRLERGAGEKWVWVRGGRCDLNAHRDVRGDALRIRKSRTLFYRLGSAE